MQQVDVDFEVWKALTGRRHDERHSYNDVLRELLGLTVNEPSGAGSAKDEPASLLDRGGRMVGGRLLPNGTRFRAKYKGVYYHAEIRDGDLIDGDGETHTSSSAAARAVTKTNVNGLLFWEVRRPGEHDWRKIAALPKAAP